MTEENLSRSREKVNPFHGDDAGQFFPGDAEGAASGSRSDANALQVPPRVSEAESESCTPPTIRGCKSDFLELSVDWLTASKSFDVFEFAEVKKAICRFFTTTGESKTWGAGAAHYDHGVEIAGFGRLVWREVDASTLNVLVDLPGEAMRFCRNLVKHSDQEITHFLATCGFGFTRCDVAMDTRDETITPAMVHRQFEKNLFSTPAKKAADGNYHARPYRDTVCGQGEQEVHAVVFPKERGRSAYMRCYNKPKECMDTTGEVLTTYEGLPVPFMTRFELETRADRANAAALQIAERGLEAIPDTFLSFIDFKDAKSAKNCERMRDAKQAAWWKRLLGSAKKYKVSSLRLPSTPERTKKHLKDNVAPQMANLIAAGLDEEWLLMEARKRKPNQVKVSQLKMYRAEMVDRRDPYGESAVRREIERRKRETEKYLSA